jgi:sugar/nucleoside kinase (ribokinase family)
VSRVLVVGDLVDDISVRVLDDVTEASDTNAEIRVRPGGSAGNVAAWLGHLGVDATFCGRVGVDAVDRHARALAELGVEAHVAGDPGTTATIVLQLDREGERTMFVDRGANRGLVPDDVPDAAWHEVEWLHLTGYTFFDPSTRPVAVELLAEARRRGARVSVDPSSVAFLRAAGGAVFLGWIDGADVIFPNLDEARALVGSTGPQIDLEALTVRFPHVVVTLGSMGAAYLSGTERTQITAPRIDVIDTTGAGDAFAAGFLARWVEGATPEEALDGGRAAAETCVAHLGARPVVT